MFSSSKFPWYNNRFDLKIEILKEVLSFDWFKKSLNTFFIQIFFGMIMESCSVVKEILEVLSFELKKCLCTFSIRFSLI